MFKSFLAEAEDGDRRWCVFDKCIKEERSITAEREASALLADGLTIRSIADS